MGKVKANDDITKREVLQVIKDEYANIFAAEKRVADYILNNPRRTVDLNVSELAKASGVSDATVVRMCHHIGYTGYYQFRITLSRDLGKQQYSSMVLKEDGDAVEQVFNKYAEAMHAIGKRIDAKIMIASANLVKNCAHAHIIAAGNSSPLAQYMGFRLGRLGVRCTYNVASEYFLNHVNLAEDNDIIIAISQSGMSKQVIKAVELGKEKGLKTIAITAYARSPLSYIADYVLLSAGTAEEFNYYKEYAHLNETAVIDALLNFVTNEEIIRARHADKLELILSENKI